MGNIGSIKYEWVQPLLISSKNTGELTEDETRLLMDVIESEVAGASYWMWEVDLSELTSMAPAARKVCAERLTQLPDRAIAVVHAKFAQKILAKLVVSAVTIIDKSQRGNEMRFFDDSTKAREWLSVCGEKKNIPKR